MLFRSLGQGAQVHLGIDQEIPDCPLKLEIWIKVFSGSDAIAPYIRKTPRNKVGAASAVNSSFSKILSSMTSMGGFQHQFKARSDEFEDISIQEGCTFVPAKTFWGADIQLLPQNEVVSSKIYTFGFFEPELTSFLIDYLFQDAIFFDVGAHIGIFSMLACELIGEKGKVFSFEPTPSTREVLHKNLAPYPQYKIVPKLAWSSHTMLDFQDYGAQYSAFNTAVSSRLNAKQMKKINEYHIQVEAVTLDAFCTDHDIRPDLVKIDAESAEMQVLEGMSFLMYRVRPVVTIEVGDMESTLKEGVPRCRDILAYAMSFDYLPLASVSGRYQLHELQDTYAYDNIIMVPREELPARRPLWTVAVQAGRFY